METISGLTLNLMLFGISYSIVLPLLLCVIFKKRLKAHIMPFFLGMTSYMTFSFILANLANSLILYFIDTDSMSKVLILLLSLCSQILFAIIAQGGKYFTFWFTRRFDDPDKYSGRGDAMEFGAGYGGLEAVMTVGLTLLTYFMYAAYINEGQMESFLANYSGSDYTNLQQQLQMLIDQGTTVSAALVLRGLGMFLFQIGTSLLIYMAIYGVDKKIYLRLAIIFNIIILVPSCFSAAGMIETPWFEALTTLIFGAATLYYGHDQAKTFERERTKRLRDEANKSMRKRKS